MMSELATERAGEAKVKENDRTGKNVDVEEAGG